MVAGFIDITPLLRPFTSGGYSGPITSMTSPFWAPLYGAQHGLATPAGYITSCDQLFRLRPPGRRCG